MRELEFTSTLSNEEIEHNFKDFDFFSCIMTALEEVFINEKEIDFNSIYDGVDCLCLGSNNIRR